MTGPAFPSIRGDEFEALRPRLRAVAYRMTGSVSDAEDLCQEAWLRWERTDTTKVDNPEAFLVSTVTRLAIDLGRSAARRRETYVGPFLPEPVVTQRGAPAEALADPERAAELADSLTFAFLVLLDQLDPVERAVLLLHDVFGYSFAEVALAVDRSVAACRQIASRARRNLDAERGPATTPDTSAEQAAIAGLLVALSRGDIEGVMAWLSPDVVQLDDGGPARRAARRPVVGPHRVARLWANLAKRIEPGWTMRVADVNGSVGLVIDDDGGTFMTITVTIGPDGLIRRVHSQLNPDKLRHLRSDGTGNAAV